MRRHHLQLGRQGSDLEGARGGEEVGGGSLRTLARFARARAGPNLNLFGRREPHIYGTTTLAQIDEQLAALAGVPLHDAIKAMPFPVLEVHMSNIAAREQWRTHSIISPAVKGTIQGLGPHSYLLALRGLAALAGA